MKTIEAILGQEVVVRGYGVGRITALPNMPRRNLRDNVPNTGYIGVTPYSCNYELHFDDRNVEPWPRAAISDNVLPPNVTGRMLDELAATGKMWRDLDAQTVWAAFRKGLTS